MSKKSFTPFNIKTYLKYLKTDTIGRSIFYFKSLESTNTFIKKLCLGVLSHGSLCITDHQTAGRGQYSRSWLTEPGKDLTFSIQLAPNNSDKIQLLLQVCALSLVEAIQDSTGLNAWMKWPNDLYLDNQKVCGILAESTFTGKKLDRVIIGIGLNVNEDRFSANNTLNAISLINILESEISRELLLAIFMGRLETNYNRWIMHDVGIVKQINRLYPCLGKKVNITVNGVLCYKNFLFLGIDKDGYPIFLDDSSSLKKFVHEQIRFS